MSDVKKAPVKKVAPVSEPVILKDENEKLKAEIAALNKREDEKNALIIEKAESIDTLTSENTKLKTHGQNSFQVLSDQEGEIEKLNEKLRQFAKVIDVQSEGVDLEVASLGLREQVLIGLLPQLNIDYPDSEAKKLSKAADIILKAWGVTANDKQDKEDSQ